MFKNKLTFYLLFLFAVMMTTVAKADGHLMIEQIRKYMNNPSPKAITEIWIGEQAFYVKNGRMIVIYRKDLGKVWTIFPARKKYYEEQINSPVKNEEENNNDKSFHKTGYDYEPVFDYVLNETKKTEKIKEIDCRQIIALGDADYAQDNIEIWFSKNVPIDLGGLYKEAVKYTISSDFDKVYKLYPELYNNLVLRSKETVENAIAPAIIYEREVSKVEKSAPPENIYEIPSGCVKVNSIEELYK